MDKGQVSDIVIGVIRELFERDTGQTIEITEKMRLKKDLGMDWLDMAEAVIGIEDKFEKRNYHRFSVDNRIARVWTVGSMINYVHRTVDRYEKAQMHKC